MKRKLKLRSILAVLLAFVITFAGIDPMGLLSGIMKDVQAADLTPISWENFSGVTYGKSYTSATALTYSETSLNNTVFEDYIQFAEGACLLYGAAGVWHGIKMGVSNGEFYVQGSQYWYNGGVNKQSRTAAQLGLTEETLAGVKLKLHVELRDVSDDMTSATVTVKVNDHCLWDSITIARNGTAPGLLGNAIQLCAQGTTAAVTIPEKPLTEISWDNFSGVEYGKTYTSATALTYSGTSLNNTAFEAYVQFAAGGYLQYGTSGTSTHGIWIGVNTDGEFYVIGKSYWKDGSSSDLGYEKKCTAADLGLTGETLAGEKLKLRVEFRNVNDANTSATVTVKVNDHCLWDAITVKRSNTSAALLGNQIYVRSNVTIPEKPLTEINWGNFSNVEYGKTYTSATALTYSGTSLNHTAFEDYVEFAAGGYLQYGTSGTSTHGIHIGVNTDGEFYVTGKSYWKDGSSSDLGYEKKCTATDLGLDGETLAGEKLKLRVEFRDVNDANTSATVTVKVNDHCLWDAITVKRSNDSAALLGNQIYMRSNVTIPEKPLTEINWDDFSNVEYGKTYTSATALTYSGISLNGTAFEDYVQFAEGASLLYGTSGSNHGISMGVNTNGEFYVKGLQYWYNSTVYGNEQKCTAVDLGLAGDTLAGVKLRLRVELHNVSDDNTSATVTIKVNDHCLWDAITVKRNAEVADLLGNTINLVTSNNTTAPVTIPAKSLKEIGWSDFAKDGTALKDGETISSERLVTYTGTDLSNTAFEGDVSLPAGSGFRYASVDGSYGLEIKESEGNLLIGGTEGVQLGESNAYTCTPEEYNVGTSFADKRFTIRIEFVYLITDSEANSSSARVNISINGIEVAKEVTLTSEVGNENCMLSNHIGLATGITVYDVAPTWEEVTTGLEDEVLSWEEFGYTGGITPASMVTKTASHLDTLKGYIFNGNIIMQPETYIRYGRVGTSGPFVLIQVDSEGVLYVGTYNSGITKVYTAIANHHNLNSFVNTEFNLKIVLTSEGEISVWINDVIMGNPFKPDITWGTTLAAKGVTPISLRTTVPTGLTEISLDDWTKDDATSTVRADFELRNNELRGAHKTLPNLLNTSLHEVVKFVDTNGSVGSHTFVYGGCTGHDYQGIKISINDAGQMGIHCVDIINGAETSVEKFTIDPVKAGVGTTFRGEEISWQLDTVRLGNHVLLYMSFNGQLYNNAPFVFHDFADSMVANMYYTSHETAAEVNNCYVILGASVKELPVLYHDLAKEAYTIPAYKSVTFYEKDANGAWVEATKPATLTKTGDYKLAFNDGLSEYTQIISCYNYATDVDVATLVRSLKMTNNTEDDWANYETRLCDKNYDGKVTLDDISDIRSMLLGTYVADTDVMKISGFYSPTASLIEDETYATIKATGVNHIIESNVYYTDDAIARYRIYQELSYAQKYGLTVTVNDKRLTDIGASGGTATADDVDAYVANYKDYQSFAGLFIFDEPKAADYPKGIWEGHDEIGTYSSVAQAIADAGYEGWSNAFTATSDILFDGYNYDYAGRMRYGYYKHLKNMVQSFKLSFMSSTHYPYLNNTSGSGETMWCYFMNLAINKAVAKAEDVELRTFVQGMAADNNDMNENYSEAQLKWNANMNLTFGTSALEYFPLVQPGSFQTYSDGSCASGLLDKDGQLTKFGEWATSVNKQVQAIDGILLNASHEGFMAIGGNSSYATTIARENVEEITMTTNWLGTKTETISHTFIEEADGYEGAKVIATDSTHGAFAGCFEISAEKHAMYIVNFNDAGENTITVDLGDGVTATAIYQGTETPYSGDFNITLAAGEAVLVVY